MRDFLNQAILIIQYFIDLSRQLVQIPRIIYQDLLFKADYNYQEQFGLFS